MFQLSISLLKCVFFNLKPCWPSPSAAFHRLFADDVLVFGGRSLLLPLGFPPLLRVTWQLKSCRQVKGQVVTYREAGLPSSAPPSGGSGPAGAAGHRGDLGIIPELIIDSLPLFTALSPDGSAPPPPPPSRPV